MAYVYVAMGFSREGRSMVGPKPPKTPLPGITGCRQRVWVELPLLNNDRCCDGCLMNLTMTSLSHRISQSGRLLFLRGHFDRWWLKSLAKSNQRQSYIHIYRDNNRLVCVPMQNVLAVLSMFGLHSTECPYRMLMNVWALTFSLVLCVGVSL